MNRRSFFRDLFGAVVAAGVALRSESLFGVAPTVIRGGSRSAKSVRLAMALLRERGRIDFMGKPIVWKVSGWVQ